SMLSTTFCAVPALSRVDPAMTSGPTATSIAMSAAWPSGEPGAHVTATMRSPDVRPWSTAPRTYAVVPDALTATRTSRAVSPAARPRAKAGRARAVQDATGDLIDGSGDARDLRTHCRDGVAVLVVHQLEQLHLAHAVETRGVTVHLLAQGLITSAAAMAQTRAAPLVAM